ncbi:MAG: hypothetical protein JWL89_420 [Candidatus Saccharibacteria bacterium]|nr:hypothetical protein [Candidatus Saccharibacteria bacterium]
MTKMNKAEAARASLEAHFPTVPHFSKHIVDTASEVNPAFYVDDFVSPSTFKGLDPHFMSKVVEAVSEQNAQAETPQAHNQIAPPETLK